MKNKVRRHCISFPTLLIQFKSPKKRIFLLRILHELFIPESIDIPVTFNLPRLFSRAGMQRRCNLSQEAVEQRLSKVSKIPYKIRILMASRKYGHLVVQNLIRISQPQNSSHFYPFLFFILFILFGINNLKYMLCNLLYILIYIIIYIILLYYIK